MTDAPPTLGVQLLRPDARLPTQGHAGDLGWDLYAVDTLTLAPGRLARIPTGIAIAFPPGIGAIVKDRSSLALRGLHCLAGVIDPDYRGEIIVVAANLGTDTIVVAAGERCAQMLLWQGLTARIERRENLDVTARGSGGFGSTGA